MTQVSLDLKRTNILVADGNRHMRLIIKNILHSYGAKNVHEAEDGADTLKEMRTFPADLVICDLMMEPLSGLEFLRMVRTSKDSPNPYVPVIMISSHTEKSYIVEARDAGVNDFLAKPISSRALCKRIKKIITHPRHFIKLDTYFGPERRDKDQRFFGPDRRMGPSIADLSNTLH